MKITLEDVVQDKTSGSLQVSQNALIVLKNYISGYTNEAEEEFIQTVAAMGKELISAHPMLVLVRKRVSNVIAYLKRIAKSEKSFQDVRRFTIQKIDEIMTNAVQIRKKIGEYGAKLITNGNKIITISSSDILKEIFLSAHKSRKKFEVFCLESRPMLEGQKFAEILAKEGISVHVYTDATMGHLVRGANIVMAGTDRFYDDGIINKMGTYPLAATAQKNNVPFYISGETDKVLKEIDKSVRFRAHSAAEVFSPKVKSVKVSNFYFEIVEYDYITKIVCEEGIYQTEDFINWYIKD